MNLECNYQMHKGWVLEIEDPARENIVNFGSNFLLGNGYLGYRGGGAEFRKEEYSACIVTDTYDNADGTWKELCNVPNPLYAELRPVKEEVIDKKESFQLNLRDGLLSRKLWWRIKNGSIYIEEKKYAHMRQRHLLLMEYTLSADCDVDLEVLTGIDGDTWNLNGEHLRDYRFTGSEEEGRKRIDLRAETVEEKTAVAVAESCRLSGCKTMEQRLVEDDRTCFRKFRIRLSAGETCVIQKDAAIYSSNDTADPVQSAAVCMAETGGKSREALYRSHREEWDRLWDRLDVHIEGDPEDQILMRFNIYHAIIAVPRHTDRLPVGARGLSCQAYQGSAFWDQEIFNMPMFLYTFPDIARNILSYRYHTLDGARRKAGKLGYGGAFYAWVSGKTGDELCPSFFFKDVLSGRSIRNHFNDWQIHISPDIVYAITQYLEVTGDWDFIVNRGAEITFEVAQFILSFSSYKVDTDRFVLSRVLGPDEYHENVDNNAFTNYQCRFAVRTALDLYERLKKDYPQELKIISDKTGLTEEAVSRWKGFVCKCTEKQPQPESGIIEQHDGYFDLEDTRPEELKKRLLDPDEYWGYPIGVAVETQVIKQADVIQLFCLHNGFDREILQANYEYYEPRTQHKSSLSPSAYAIIASRLGKKRDAHRYFKKSLTVDLYNTGSGFSGGTFIGGIHTAACGASWMMAVFGFAGLRVSGAAVFLQPALPDSWKRVSFSVTIKGGTYSLTVSEKNVRIVADLSKGAALEWKVFGTSRVIDRPGTYQLGPE
jgi:kojibiose phosphorylase